jgi:hypothetical protein
MEYVVSDTMGVFPDGTGYIPCNCEDGECSDGTFSQDSCVRTVTIELFDKLTNVRFYRYITKVLFPKCHGCLDKENTSMTFTETCDGRRIGELTLCESGGICAETPHKFDIDNSPEWVGVGVEFNPTVNVTLEPRGSYDWEEPEPLSQTEHEPVEYHGYGELFV